MLVDSLIHFRVSDAVLLVELFGRGLLQDVGVHSVHVVHEVHGVVIALGVGRAAVVVLLQRLRAVAERHGGLHLGRDGAAGVGLVRL